MSDLFQPVNLGNLELVNRFVRSATWEGMADESGRSTENLADLMAALARGGVGLIISGHAYISREGQAGPWQLGVYSDDLVPGLRVMAEKVHNAGGKIVLQLAHAGCQAAGGLTGLQALGPSPMNGEEDYDCRAMSKEDITRVVRDFGLGAARAMRSGFDGVQIHAAHGYLLSQFLSPYFNRREDEYGGDVRNRARIVLQVFEEIKGRTDREYPVLIKLNSRDFLSPGFEVEEMIEVSELLGKKGLDAVELSGGTGFSRRYIPPRKGEPKTQVEEAYYRDAAALFKKRLHLPLILVGGIRSFEVAEDLVRKNEADLISLCRPLIREPDLVKRWQSGDVRSSGCQSDNLCFKPIRDGKGISCPTKLLEKKRGEEPF